MSQRGLEGRVAIVTGGSDGLGKEFARGLAEAGARIVVAARRVELLEQVAAELRDEHGVETIAVPTDICNEGSVTGELTVTGVSKPSTLHTEFSGVVTDPWGGTRAVFSAKGEVNREDWGLNWNMPLDKGGVLVSKNIDFEIETEIVLQK